MKTENTYNVPFAPIDPDFTDVVQQYVDQKKNGKVHYFNYNGLVDTIEGSLDSIVKREFEVFLSINQDESVRLDRVITLMGRPGPAYDEYDRYGNACLTCEDIGQFGVK